MNFNKCQNTRWIDFQSNQQSNYDSFLTNSGNTNKTNMDMVEPTNTGLLEVKSLPHLWQLVWQSQTLSSEITKATDCTSSSELKVWPRHLSENSRPWILEPGRYALKIHFCFNFQTGGRTLNFPTVPEDQCRIFGIVWSKLAIFMQKGDRFVARGICKYCNGNKVSSPFGRNSVWVFQNILTK